MLLLLLLAAAPPAGADTLFAAAGTSIYAVGMDGHVSLYATKAGGITGLTVDQQGNLYASGDALVLGDGDEGTLNLITVITPQKTVGVVGPVGPEQWWWWAPFDSLALAADGTIYASAGASNEVVRVQRDGTTVPFAVSRRPTALAVDSQDRVYVASATAGTVTRFAADGTWEVLARDLPGPAGIALDSADVLYVGGADGTIRRIPPGGTPNIFARGVANPACLAFDATGNLYVGGQTAISRIDPQGHRSVFANLPVAAVALALYRGGALPPSEGPIGFTQVWSGANTVTNDTTVAIATSGQGGLYVAGSAPGGASFAQPGPPAPAGPPELFLSKLDPDGRLLWTRRPAGTNTALLRALGLDAQGDVYLAGNLGFTNDVATHQDRQVCLVKTDAEGQPLWRLAAGLAGQMPISALAVSPGGEACVAGEGRAVYLIKVAASGAVVWTNSFARTGPGGPVALALDRNSEVCLAGSFAGSMMLGGAWVGGLGTNQTLFLAKLDAAGTVVWAATAGGWTGPALVTGTAVAPDQSIYVAGAVTGPAVFGSLFLPDSTAVSKPFLAKAGPDGRWVWVRKGVGANGAAGALTVDQEGNPYLCGTFNGALWLGDLLLTGGAGTYANPSFTGRDLFLTKLNSTGDFLWARHAGAGTDATGSVRPVALTTDAAGGVYVAGQFWGETHFGGLLNSTHAAPSGLFVARLTTNTPPVITEQPQPVTVLEGRPAVLRVAARGQGPLRYRWRFVGLAARFALDLSDRGGTNAALVLDPLQLSDGGTYWVDVADEAGMVSSSPAPVNVLPLPRISLEPSGAFAESGAMAFFSVQVQGTPPFTYQWSFNGTMLAGETNASLIRYQIGAGQSGVYTVRITDRNAAVVSAPAELVVVPVAAAAPGRLLVTLGPDGRALVGLKAVWNQAVVIQRSTDLVTWTPWASFTGRGWLANFTDPDAPTNSRRFYRAVTP